MARPRTQEQTRRAQQQARQRAANAAARAAVVKWSTVAGTPPKQEADPGSTDTSSGDPGGAGSAPATTTDAPTANNDGQAQLQASIPGLPQWLSDYLWTTYFEKGKSVAEAYTYVRSTDWYKQEYAGIDQGRALGIFSDEGGYRAYKTGLNQAYRQYYGRDATTDEVGYWIGLGEGGDTVGRRFAGAAWADANQGDLQYVTGAFDSQGALSQQDVQQLGLQQVGLGGSIGSTLEKRVQDAQAKMQRVFDGVLASPQFGFTSFGTLASSRRRADTGA